MSITDLLNPYDRRARLYPALLVILPLAIMMPAVFGVQPETLVPVAITCGAGFLLTRIARNAGIRLEPALWKSWGGPPTTQLLRHRDQQIDPYTKARYHKRLSKLLDLEMPSAKAEEADRGDADMRYLAATKRLIQLTRDRKRFPLVFNENAAYGFHRNGLGLKWIGMAVALMSIVVVLWSSGIAVVGQEPWLQLARKPLGPAAKTSLAASVAMLIAWLVVFTETQVQRTAFAYARRLLESCDDLAAGKE